MKMIRNVRLFVLMLALSLMSMSAVVALPTFEPRNPSPVPVHTDKIYACHMCEMASAKGGKCKKCGMAMEEIHGKFIFSCAKCKTTADKAGNCPKCGKFMAKMVQTYACTKCHTTADKAGKCPKCGKFMAKKILPMAK